MLRGRHRGLPAAIDRSVLLPGEMGRQAEMEMQFRARQEVVRQALREAVRRETVVGRGERGDAQHENVEDCPPGLA